MKKNMILAVTVFIMATTLNSADAHMMERGSMMQGSGETQQEENYQPQHHPYMMYRGMMGGYGMGPGMMGGYGMGPGMMGGYGMGPGMMGGYGMGPGMMGGYGFCPGPGMGRFSSPEQFNSFLDQTKDLRRELHGLRFDYGEMMRNPKATGEERNTLEKKMFELQQKIQEKAFE